MSNHRSIVVGFDSSIGPNDVLLGRGNHLHNSGNEKFRSLVRSRSLEYWSCNDNVVKDDIARQIVDSVTSQQGRFLRKVKNNSVGTACTGTAVSTSRDSGDLVPTEQWEVADTETVLVKIKQTFRDFTASNKKRNIDSACKTSPVSPSDGPINLQQVSILERLQNYNTLTSPPFGSLSDLNNNSQMFTPPAATTTDTYEMLFQNARASQLDHLVHNAQQQLHHQDSQDRQLMSLFEQQRAILMTQLQQSSLASDKKAPINQPSQYQPPYHHFLPQPPHTSLQQESVRLPIADQDLPQTHLTAQLYPSPNQDQFLQGQNNQRLQQYLMEQQLRALGHTGGTTGAFVQPQYTTLPHQNVPTNPILSSLMYRNIVPNLQNSTQPQPSLPYHSSISTTAAAAVPPMAQHQYATSAHSNDLNEYDLNQGIPFPSTSIKLSGSSNNNNNSVNELLAMFDPVPLPGAVSSYPPHPLLPQVTTADTVHPPAARNDDDNSIDDNVKPPAL